MTPIPHTAEVAAPATVAEVKQMLRDLGYALKLSRRISAQILADRESKRSAFVRASEEVQAVTQSAPNPAEAFQLHS